MEDIGWPRAYLLFATTRVFSEPTDGDRISTRSPGFRKRSGAEVLSGNNSLESAAVPAADDVAGIKRKVARQVFEIFAE